MKPQRGNTKEAGFTLIELLIALTIFALVSVNIAMVSRTGTKAAESDLFRQLLNNEMDMTLDRIKLALMSASADNVYPTLPAPASHDYIDFSTSMGVQGGRHVIGSPERIRWQVAGANIGNVLWTQALGLPGEREILWSRNVPTMQNDEVINTLDDNTNDLIDEPGLAFHVEQLSKQELQIFVTLTIAKEDSNGREVPVHRRINVTCRN